MSNRPSFDEMNTPSFDKLRKDRHHHEQGQEHAESMRDEAYGHPKKFHGLNLGIIKIGVTGGSLDIGANIGIAKAEVNLGLNNSVKAGVNLGPVMKADGGVGVGIGKHGLHAGVAGGAHLLKLVGADTSVRTAVGPTTGVDGTVGAYVGPADARVAAGTSASEQGLGVGANVAAGVKDAVGLNAGAEAALSENSHFDSRIGGKVGDSYGIIGTGIYSDGNRTIHPDFFGQGVSPRGTSSFDVNPSDAED